MGGFASHAEKSSFEQRVKKSTMIVPVYLRNLYEPHKETLLYAMLDSQSDATFISERALKSVGAKSKTTQILISTITSQDKTVNCSKCDHLAVRGYGSNIVIPLPAVFSRKSIPANRDHIPRGEMIDSWPHLEPIRNNLMPIIPNEVGLLIGYDCSQALAPRDVIISGSQPDGPFAMKTDLGWGIVGIVSPGRAPMNEDGVTSHRILAVTTEGAQITLPARIKELNSPGACLKLLEADFADHAITGESPSREEKRFLQLMEEGIIVDATGHYNLPLPFNDNHSLLFDNRELVVGRMRTLKRKLERDPEFREEYVRFMDDMLQKGYAEKVIQAADAEGEKVWYIPHFGTYHKVKRKLRIVFDCAAKYKGVCLNDTLLKGPDLVNTLIGVLCRFRKERIAFCCDIEKMFYSFRVHQADRNVLRFLWWENGDTGKPLIPYRMTSHIFGAISSPACATYGLRAIANEFNDKYGEDVQSFIHNDFYVDDGLKSVSDVEYAQDLINRTIKLCEERGVRLHKFVSNSVVLLRSLPPSERAREEIRLDMEDCPRERILGITWDPRSDVFKFEDSLKIKSTTRRGILSAASTIFDPFGWISPFTIRSKLILQEMCKQKLGWDDEVSAELVSKWLEWCSELPYLKELKIPRSFKMSYQREIESAQLHHFADASMYAYGTCAYLRLQDVTGNVSVHLVMAKARVAPRNVVTIPRLELMAAVIATRIAIILEKELKYPMIEHVYWTDSKIVLGYIANESRRFKIFVGNRVQQIRDVSEPAQWHYIQGEENPADLASRGMPSSKLVKADRWFTGPDFLRQKNLVLKGTAAPELHLDDPEVKEIVVCHQIRTGANVDCERFSNFSSWHSLRRGVALAVLWMNRLRCRTTRSTTRQSVVESLNVTALEIGEKIILRSTQWEAFEEEIGQLNNGKGVDKISPLSKLDCFLDDDGLLRVGGRLRYSRLYEHQKHPLILPGGGHVTTLLLNDCHNQVRHQGRGMTINEVRGRGFWVVGLNRAVKRLIFHCVICRHLRGKPQCQKMADLPAERVERSPPFSYCGVDFFGPFLVKEKRKEIKRYGVVFTCLASRAIHLEMAHSLTTSSFIQALRRMQALRGPIRLIRCDNGTNLVGANNELAKSIASINSTELKAFLLRQDCDTEFRMNPPKASHMGGAWERMIRIVRSILNALLDAHGTRLDDESLGTFLYEVAAVINSRPLALDHVTDPEHPEPLTPNHLLMIKSKVILPPPGQFSDTDLYSIKRWRGVQYLVDQFWVRWKREYLPWLQLRQKWLKVERDLRVGDVVLLVDELAPRNLWKRGRVIEVYPSQDKRVRKVKVCVNDPPDNTRPNRSCSTSTLVRPIHKLVLLLPTTE